MFKSNPSRLTPASRLSPSRSNKMRPSFRAKRGISLWRRRPMIRALYSFFLLSVLALTGASASAQVQTGTPPFGSFGGGPDVINLANLNAHIGVPVLHKAGRDTNFTYDLNYE